MRTKNSLMGITIISVAIAVFYYAVVLYLVKPNEPGIYNNIPNAIILSMSIMLLIITRSLSAKSVKGTRWIISGLVLNIGMRLVYIYGAEAWGTNPAYFFHWAGIWTVYLLSGVLLLIGFKKSL